MNGKKRRLLKFRYPNRKTGLIVPIDHGLTVGPLTGIGSVREISRWISHNAIRGVIAHKGMAERLTEAGLLADTGLMIHLNGMTTLAARPDDKAPLTSIATAIRLGADGVSLQVNFDGRNDAENLRTIGSTIDEAGRYGLPVLAMVYDKVTAQGNTQTQRLRHLLRACLELGCDAVKIAPPSQLVAIPEILDGISEDLSIFFAGGAASEDDQVFSLALAATAAGAAGLCVGRNVFNREDSGRVLDELRQILAGPAGPLREIPRLPAERVYGAH